MNKLIYVIALLLSVWTLSSCSDNGGENGDTPPNLSGGDEQILYSFTKGIDVLAGELNVTIELKNMDGTYYIAKEDIHLPFAIDETSTAQLGTHFTVDGDATEFVVKKGKREASVKLIFKEPLEEGKDNIVMVLKDLSENYVAGEYDKIQIKVYGPTTVAKLFGKWVFKETTSFEDIETNYFASASDMEKAPKNNSNADTLEFVAGETDKLIPHVSGDMKNYFRECDVTYLNDEIFMDAYNGEERTLSVMELSAINVNYSGNVENPEIRKGQIGCRLLDDDMTLEITIYDYVPIDFFQGIYASMNDGTTTYPMKFVPLIYYFTKVD